MFFTLGGSRKTKTASFMLSRLLPYSSTFLDSTEPSLLIRSICTSACEKYGSFTSYAFCITVRPSSAKTDDTALTIIAADKIFVNFIKNSCFISYHIEQIVQIKFATQTVRLSCSVSRLSVGLFCFLFRLDLRIHKFWL